MKFSNAGFLGPVLSFAHAEQAGVAQNCAWNSLTRDHVFLVFSNHRRLTSPLISDFGWITIHPTCGKKRSSAFQNKHFYSMFPGPSATLPNTGETKSKESIPFSMCHHPSRTYRKSGEYSFLIVASSRTCPGKGEGLSVWMNTSILFAVDHHLLTTASNATKTDKQPAIPETQTNLLAYLKRRSRPMKVLRLHMTFIRTAINIWRQLLNYQIWFDHFNVWRHLAPPPLPHVSPSKRHSYFLVLPFIPRWGFTACWQSGQISLPSCYNLGAVRGWYRIRPIEPTAICETK